jgi:hypothetical protein
MLPSLEGNKFTYDGENVSLQVRISETTNVTAIKFGGGCSILNTGEEI